MKKYILCTLTLLLLFCFSSCGSKSNYNYTLGDFIDYELEGTNGRGRIGLTINYPNQDDFSNSEDYDKAKEYINELFSNIEISKEADIQNGDEIVISVNKDFKKKKTNFKMDLSPFSFEVSGLEEAKHLDLFGEEVVKFYALVETEKVVPIFSRDCPLSKEIQDNLIYDISLSTARPAPLISDMDIDANLNEDFLKKTDYSNIEEYFESIGYIVETHSTQKLEEYFLDKELLVAEKSEDMENILNNKLSELGNVDGYNFVGVASFQKTNTTFLYNIVAKYQNGDNIAYILFETEMAYHINEEVIFITLNNLGIVDSKYASEALEGNKLIYTYDI